MDMWFFSFPHALTSGEKPRMWRSIFSLITIYSIYNVIVIFAYEYSLVPLMSLTSHRYWRVTSLMSLSVAWWMITHPASRMAGIDQWVAWKTIAIGYVVGMGSLPRRRWKGIWVNLFTFCIGLNKHRFIFIGSLIARKYFNTGPQKTSCWKSIGHISYRECTMDADHLTTPWARASVAIEFTLISCKFIFLPHH